MQLNPYLTFNGRCAEAFKFYEKCLGGKLEAMLTHGESPIADQVAPDWRDRIMHARLVVGNTVLMGSDSPPQFHEDAKGFSVSIGVDRPADAERIFNELAKDGTVRLPLQQTFWAARFGMFVDRFGISWMVNCGRPA